MYIVKMSQKIFKDIHISKFQLVWCLHEKRFFSLWNFGNFKSLKSDVIHVIELSWMRERQYESCVMILHKLEKFIQITNQKVKQNWEKKNFSASAKINGVKMINGMFWNFIHFHPWNIHYDSRIFFFAFFYISFWLTQ